MGNTLYLECSSGISGDMTVAALLDLGADETVLRGALASLPVGGYEIGITRVKKSGLDACDFQVKLDHAHENHDHDMEYLHGHHHDEEEDGHDHVHSHSHEHRGLPEIQQIIRAAAITDHAKEIALRVFHILAEAEAKAHGVPLEQVHFHEVGAVDSIVDIVAAAVCLDNLDITEVIVPQLCEGRGFVRCQHGVIPVPVPAVLNIVQANDLHLHLTEVEGELVTPTGAAIAAAVRTSDHLPEEFQILRAGIGAGKRTYERPSLLRAMLIMQKNSAKEDIIYRLESNIDDSTGESLGYCMERLLSEGARDVWYTPIFMKKNRPAFQLNVLCEKDQIPKLEAVIFAETTTIGIRKIRLERTILPREVLDVQTPYGPAKAKLCTLPDGERRVYPEYESVKALAAEKKLPFRKVFESVLQAADTQD